MTHKLLTVVCALALVLGLSLSATAAVQNVKVGGDIDVKGIWQNDYDVYSKVENIIFSGIPALEARNTVYFPLLGLYGYANNDAQVRDYSMETARVYVEASLTDNVSAYVRLLQSHDWGLNNFDPADDVEVDLAYLTLSEMFGYPFSLTIGRQELQYGEGFLVGDGIRNTNGVVNQTYQYDTRKAFDAIKGEWNYAPHKIDLFTAKYTEGSNVGVGGTPQNTDNDLYGLDWNYDGGVYGLWDFALFYDRNNTVSTVLAPADGENQTWALSVRGEGNIPQVSVGTLALKGEVVKEWGLVEGNLTTTGSQEALDAWGGYAEAEYTFNNSYAPYIGLGYIYLSGDSPTTDRIETFNPLFENETYGQIAEVVYGEGATAYALGAGLNSGDTTMTNASIWKLSAGLNPTAHTNIDFTYYNLWAPESTLSLTGDLSDQSKDIGDEYDVTFTYNYTEDVSFGLMYALFVPGKFFEIGANNSGTSTAGDTEYDVNLRNAQELVGSVKVTF